LTDRKDPPGSQLQFGKIFGKRPASDNPKTPSTMRSDLKSASLLDSSNILEAEWTDAGASPDDPPYPEQFVAG
jgi:hypothetical protein